MTTRTLAFIIAVSLAGPAAAAADCTTVKLSTAHPTGHVTAKQVTYVKNLGPDAVLVKEHGLKLAATDADLWVGHPGAPITTLLATGAKSAKVRFCSTSCTTSECVNQILK